MLPIFSAGTSPGQRSLFAAVNYAEFVCPRFLRTGASPRPREPIRVRLCFAVCGELVARRRYRTRHGKATWFVFLVSMRQPVSASRDGALMNAQFVVEDWSDARTGGDGIFRDHFAEVIVLRLSVQRAGNAPACERYWRCGAKQSYLLVLDLRIAQAATGARLQLPQWRCREQSRSFPTLGARSR